ncbi:MAG: ABC transporter permease [Bifidobacteriaceae bacterium]|jgi:putative ABC transport system permease protein|nr:ABC transporter permease [Bifidobacteriaceae bacterium]
MGFVSWVTTAFAAGQLEQGLVYGFAAMGVFLTFRILNFADLTVDSSFTTGAGTTAVLISHGVNPWVATLCGFCAGALAGLITALLHTKLHIDPLLASIITMVGLWSVNLRIMGGSRIGLINEDTIFTPLRKLGPLTKSYWPVLVLVLFALIIIWVTNWLLSTNLGLAVQATGDNPTMASALGVSTDTTKILTLMYSNGLVGLSGAVLAQLNNSSDISMGVGQIVAGLAGVIIGNAIFGTRFMFLAVLGAMGGSVLYHLVVYWALYLPFFGPNDMKLISAVIVVLALVISQSKKLRALFARISPMRQKHDAPEPMLEVPGKEEEA